jgi:hypothetical protein
MAIPRRLTTASPNTPSSSSEDVQAISNDGNGTAAAGPAYYMTHVVYDIAAPHSNTIDPRRCYYPLY